MSGLKRWRRAAGNQEGEGMDVPGVNVEDRCTSFNGRKWERPPRFPPDSPPAGGPMKLPAPANCATNFTMLRSPCAGCSAAFFLVAGANHFRMPEIYLGMMPPGLPWPKALNYFCGAAEMLGGLGVLLPRHPPLGRLGFDCPARGRVSGEPARRTAGVGCRASISHPPRCGCDCRFRSVFIAWVWWVAVKRDPSETRA